MKCTIQRTCMVVRDLDEAIPRYEGLTGAKLIRTGAAVEKFAGVKAAAAWKSGIELASPIGGSENPAARHMQRFLDAHGESIYCTVYQVDDLVPALEQALASGYEVMIGPISFSQEEIDRELGGELTRFEEVVVFHPTQHDFLITYVVFEWK